MGIFPFPDRSAISASEIKTALVTATKQVRRNLPHFTQSCQNHTSVNNFYPSCENIQWTCGFWPGEVWLAYEYTGDETFARAGQVLVSSFLNRALKKIEVDHHDMGFLYTPSCVSAYRLTGNEGARKAALLAADYLALRYHPIGEFLQAWGALGEQGNYRFIIDCLMNLPLLYWATEQTNDESYRCIALKHTATCVKYSIREDGSTFHTIFINPITGDFVNGVTCQGYSDDSIWTRGQAWAVYGMALCYRYTKDPLCLDIFRKILGLYLSKLPHDLIPYWDMIFTTDTGEPRDSSSASIVVCGLLEMAKYAEFEEAETYTTIAKQMMKSLVDDYSVRDPAISNGLVLHATYSKKSPYNTCTPEGVDECASWGDYFYMEALLRLYSDWKPYW